MSDTRARVLSYIRGFIKNHGYSPSMKQIGDGVGLASLSSVTHQLERLEDEGMIQRQPGIPRSIVVVTK